MKKAYYYLFYKLYRSIEYTSDLSGGKFLTSFKAGLVMIALEVWILMSLGAYYAIYGNVPKLVTAMILNINLLVIN